MRKTICELFAGVGGFKLAFDKSFADWDTVWVNQYEPSRKSQWAFECYVENFIHNNISKEELYVSNKEDKLNPWNKINKKVLENNKEFNEYSNVDIREVNKKDENIIPNHNLLVAGFPCQDYSVANTKARGIQGEKGNLWWEIRKIIKEKRPKFILLENVNRLLRSPSKQRGRDFAILLTSLKELGYDVEWRVVNAANYSCPQKRKRVYIIAYHKSTRYFKIRKGLTHKTILFDKGFFNPLFKIKGYNNIKTSTLDKNINQIFNDFEFDFQNSGILKNGIIYSAKVKANKKKEKVLGEILEDKVDERYFIDKKDIKRWEYLKGAKSEKREGKDGFEYIYREGDMSFPDDLDKPARTILTSESNKSRSSHIIRDKKSGRLRVLTPKECERINTFPDNWTKTETMSHSFRYFAMGNALVVDLVKRIANKLGRVFDKE